MINKFQDFSKKSFIIVIPFERELEKGKIELFFYQSKLIFEID